MEDLKPIEYRLLPKNEDKPPLFKKGKKGTLKGYAIIWDTPYYFGAYIEKVSRDAIKDADLSDIVCCLNHQDSLVLGRTTSGTLKVGSDSRGFWYECLIPDTPTGIEVQELVERGDLHQCSFSFRLAKGGDTWEQKDPGSQPVRTLTAFHSIVDVSVVTWPASPTTSVYVQRSAPDEVDTDNEIDRIHAAQAQMMERGNVQLKALTTGSTTTTTWTPTVFPDSDFARMESIMKWDAEIQLLKMKNQRATDAHIDLILERMEATINADSARMANRNKQFTTKRF